MQEQKKVVARFRSVSEPLVDFENEPDVEPNITPPWEPTVLEQPLPEKKPVGPLPSGPPLPIGKGGHGVPADLAKLLDKLQRTIEDQQQQITKLKAATIHDGSKLSHEEVVRLAQEIVDKQAAAGNVGEYEWRVQIHGMQKPIVMRIDSKDRDSAIGKLYVKHGVQFNAKRMDMRLVG